MTAPAPKSFRATLERKDSPLKWVIVRIPFDVHRVWGSRGQLRVQGEINGFAFRTSLFPDGQGGHTLLVNKGMQAGGKVAPGMQAQFHLAPDAEERTVVLPAELKRLLAEKRALERWYSELNPSTRRDICRWVGEVKSPEARQRRAEQIAERLLATMEAERDLPPAIKLALARDPRAREGWERMSPSRRRGHLLGIFYYRTPEAQARRLAKALEDCRKTRREPGASR